MRVSWRHVTVCLCTLSVALASAVSGRDCTVTQLSWSADGSALVFVAGDGPDPFRLRVDVTSGLVTALAPRVEDPSWNPVHQRVLFRDDFGVYEVASEAAQPRPLVFLPDGSNTFLRALGCDAQGALLLWTIERDTGAHVFWRRHAGGLDRLPGAATGAEALRAWDARNVARPFDAAGGMFARSSCAQRGRSEHRLCLERLTSAGTAFRVVLAAPGRTSVVLDRCAPNAQAIDADSSLVVLGLFEEPDGDGRCEVLSLWLSDFETATRVSETLLQQPWQTGTRRRAWVHWLSASEFLWADAAGQLLRVHVAPPRATLIVRGDAASPPTVASSTPAAPGEGENGPSARGTDGSVAFVRHRSTAHGLQSEIWITSPGAPARLLVPTWAVTGPTFVP